MEKHFLEPGSISLLQEYDFFFWSSSAMRIPMKIEMVIQTIAIMSSSMLGSMNIEIISKIAGM
jgi:hypothetical protein